MRTESSEDLCQASHRHGSIRRRLMTTVGQEEVEEDGEEVHKRGLGRGRGHLGQQIGDRVDQDGVMVILVVVDGFDGLRGTARSDAMANKQQLTSVPFGILPRP